MIVNTVTELTSALASASQGDVIQANDVIVPNAAYGKAVKSGVTLTGKVTWLHYGSGYMDALFYAQDYAKFLDLILVGAGGYGRYGQEAGACGIRAPGRKGILIEDCDIGHFRGAGVWFGDGAASITRWNDDSQRNILRRTHIHHVQQYGFGYGVGEMGGQQSFLVDDCDFDNCRHHVMNAGGTPSYEIRNSRFGDAVYFNSNDGSGTKIYSHQVDSHGGGYYGFKAGTHLLIHGDTFSLNNGKPNIMIRGVVSSECIVEANHTPKVVSDYTRSNMLVQLAGEEGGPWDGPSDLLSTANVVCRNLRKANVEAIWCA